MLNGLVIFAILVLFGYYEILLFLSNFLPPGEAFSANERLLKRAAHQIFNLFGFRRRASFRLEDSSGRELPERFLLVSNHQSLMDIPVLVDLLGGRKLRFVAKRELGTGFPFVSTVLRRQGHALIRRDGDAAQAMRALVRFARRCEEDGTCPVIFPEGTRSKDGQVGAFHTAGVRKILAETPLPVVAAAMDGGRRVARAKDLFRNLQGIRYRVRILSVTEPLTAKREVLDAISRSREAIAACVAEMRAEDDQAIQAPRAGE